MQKIEKPKSKSPTRSHHPGTRWQVKGFVLVLAALAAIGAFELVLRVAWHNPYRYESPDHLLKFRMHHPGTDHIYNRDLIDSENPQVRLRADARSYILPSFQYRDPDGTIAFLGGSTTECMGVLEDLRFPALVSSLMAERGVRINTLNIARSGNNLHDSLNLLLNHVVGDRPDIAVIMHASNDIEFLRRMGSYRSRMGRPVSIRDLSKWAMQMASSRSYVLGLVRQSATFSGVRPQDPETDWRRNEPPVGEELVPLYRQRLRAFIHICRDFGIVPVLMTQPFSHSTNTLTPAWLDPTAQDQFNTIIREIGKDEDAAVIDLVRHLQQQVPGWEKPNEVFYDAIHVNDKGSHVYARHITEQLLPMVLDPDETAPLE